MLKTVETISSDGFVAWGLAIDDDSSGTAQFLATNLPVRCVLTPPIYSLICSVTFPLLGPHFRKSRISDLGGSRTTRSQPLLGAS